MTLTAEAPTAAVRMRAIGTYVHLLVTAVGALAEARALLATRLRELDEACSRFRPDSDVCAVERAEGRPVAVSATLLAAVDVALRAAAMTDGDLDPTIGGTLRALGYDHDFDRLPADGPAPVHVARRATWRDIEADAETGTLAVPPGTVLDLGATAKAWAADCAAADIAARLGCGVLVNLGGDIAVAGPSPARGWSVRITGTPPDESGAVVSITSGGLATSSSGARRWRRGGCVLHHIVDPRTSTSAATPWVTVSVAAASCLDANIASTTSVIRGAAAPGWLRRLELPARLVDHSGNVQVLGGWPADGAP